ncbi:hypothetical protein C8Q74DRAFT_1371503 [Fomes fomentarius]|nr:hypothetical protein C8Q74DRAFT_1371503 [Fomes fomentarius]
MPNTARHPQPHRQGARGRGRAQMQPARAPGQIHPHAAQGRGPQANRVSRQNPSHLATSSPLFPEPIVGIDDEDGDEDNNDEYPEDDNDWEPLPPYPQPSPLPPPSDPSHPTFPHPNPSRPHPKPPARQPHPQQAHVAQPAQNSGQFYGTPGIVGSIYPGGGQQGYYPYPYSYGAGGQLRGPSTRKSRYTVLVDSNRIKDSKENTRRYRELSLFHKYKLCFRRVPQYAPPDIRKKLEVPCMIMLDVPARQSLFFIPTGAFKKHQGGQRVRPNKQDETAIGIFVDAANAMLPDEDARARAGFHTEDMVFYVVPVDAVWSPMYSEQEAEDVKELRRGIQAQLMP